MRAIIDIETDGLKPSKIWVMVVKNADTNEIFVYLSPPTKEELNWITEIIGHNIIEFDLPAILKLWYLDFKHCKITDTLVLSRMMWQAVEGGHSLEAWGVRLGFPKAEFNDWSHLSQQMIDYCVRDVNVNHKLYDFLTSKMSKFEDAIKLEMDTAQTCKEMHDHGFPFQAHRARRILKLLEGRVSLLDQQIQQAFPAKAVLLKETTPSTTKTGSIRKADYRGIDPTSNITVGAPFTVIQWKTFNPNSSKQICERLHEFGWKPTAKTDGHAAARSKEDLEKYSITGWKINEENLATLPNTAPEGARLLVLRLLLETRIRKLKEWLEAYSEQTGRIHGTFNSIGTWTHRMSHNNPNMGNISAKKSIKYNSPELNKIAVYLGGIFRSLWYAEKGKILVGVDAEGIQLRILAHYMKDANFIHAVTSGKKEDGTDPHTLNKKILGDVCSTRDKAKTFIYAFLLGAGTGKIAQIFDCSNVRAKQANDTFVAGYPGLRLLKSQTIPSIADRGFFYGLDGRPVVVTEERLVLAGLLQEGESTLVKKAVQIAKNKISKTIPKPCPVINIVHDEMIFMVDDDGETCYKVLELAEQSIKEAGEILKLDCPMKGDGHVGYNWLTIH